MVILVYNFFMNIHHIYIFDAVAQTGSITKAAEILFLSQPAVSQQLKELERSLGVTLFQRLPRGVLLTEAGTILYEYSRKMRRLEIEAESSINELIGLQRGSLLIGASLNIGSYFLPNICAEFCKIYPSISVKVEIANTDSITAHLLNSEMEIGLVEGLTPENVMQSDVFAHDELVPVISPRNKLASHTPLSANRFCSEPFIVRETGSGTRAITDQALEKLGLLPKISLTLGSSEAIKRAVMADAGVAIISRMAVESELLSGSLIALPIPQLTIIRNLYRIYPGGFKLSHCAQAFNRLLFQSELQFHNPVTANYTCSNT